MRFVQIMKDKAKEYHNRLVLPEATESRTLRAARALGDMQIPAELFLWVYYYRSGAFRMDGRFCCSVIRKAEG